MSQFRWTHLFTLNLNFLLTFLGGVFLGVLVYHLGLHEVLEHLGKIGPGWLSIGGQEILPLLANTAAWNYAFAPEDRTVGFLDLLRMRLVGNGLNYLVPATFAGEIYRINSLRRDMPVTRGAASVTVAKFNHFCAAIIAIALGLTFAAPFAPLRPGLIPWLWAGLAVCLVLLGGFYLSLRQRLFERAAARLKNWLPARLYAYLPTQQIEETDGLVAAYLALDRRSLFASVAFYTLGWALGLVEIFLIFHFLGLATDLATLVMVETLSILLEIGLFFIPIKLGTTEGGRVLVFLALGLPATAGLSFAIVRRLKELIWAGIGLAFVHTVPLPSPDHEVEHGQRV
jgi:uncharacterized protein (TIRG00374 family)